MAERSVIDVDLDFIKDITNTASGDALKKCYQCATCSSVCPISTEKSPFPRKEMLYASWGLTEKVARSSDIWLCHQCTDCSEYCPRGAKPGEVMGVLRRKSIEYYSPLSFINKLANSPFGVLALLAIPVVILLGLLKANGTWLAFWQGSVAGKTIIFSNIFPQTTMVDPVFIGAVLFAAVSAFAAIKKFWADMKTNAGEFKPTGSILASLVETVKDILAHKKLKKCGKNKNRKFPHQILVFSFIGLSIVTSLVAVNHYMIQFLGSGLFHDTPLEQMNPVKLLANFSGVLLILGILILSLNRLAAGKESGSSFFDWTLILIILGVGVTGFLSEFTRMAGYAGAAYRVYFSHLVLIFFLFAFMPYTKFAHIVFRTTAVVFSKYSGQDDAGEDTSATSSQEEAPKPEAATA